MSTVKATRAHLGDNVSSVLSSTMYWNGGVLGQGCYRWSGRGALHRVLTSLDLQSQLNPFSSGRASSGNLPVAGLVSPWPVTSLVYSTNSAV